ncbi:hypothetical protein AYK21_02895 [Thermoplasmatales archaeon SG8-52-2]|nr:MAG: hypothetical protein AYK21_02895 [Thermoplasmatales archaeon SG8-52-2]
MNKFFISILLISFLLSGINIQGQESNNIFFEDDCNCSLSDMELTRTILDTNGRGVECWFKKAPKTWIQPMKISLLNSADEAQQAFDSQLIIPEPGQPGTYSLEKQNVYDAIDSGLNYQIVEDELTGTLFSFIWRDNRGFQGRRILIYNDVYILRIKGIDFESDTEIINTMNEAEACLKAVVDSKGSVVEEEKQEEEISGSFTIYDRPLRYMYVILEYDGEMYDAVTDEHGRFNFTVDKKDITNYEITCYLEYFRDNISFFSIHQQDQEEIIKISFTIKNSEIVSTVLDLGQDEGRYTISTDSLNIENIRFDDISKKYSNFNDYGIIYLHSSEVIEFYKDYLGENIELETPVAIKTRLDKGIRYDFKDGESWIVIDPGKTHYKTKFAPSSREYHELSHHAMRALYGGEFPISPPSLGVDINHAGYKNPSTADSFVEGFAVFMSAIIGEYFENWWTENKNPSLVSPMANLEVNIEAWERGGAIEDLAAAGVLWDLYDGDEQIEKAEQSREKKLNKFQEFMFKNADINNDNILTKDEYIAVSLYATYNNNYVKNLNERALDNTELANLISKEVIPVTNISLSFTKEEINQFKEDLNISSYDNDVNGWWDSKEFSYFFEEKIGESDDLDKIFSNYDENKDNKIAGDELEGLAVGEYLRKDYFIKENDLDGNNELNLIELENISDWIEPRLLDSHPDLSKDLDKLKNGANFDDYKNSYTGTIDYSDDDNVSIAFSDIWKILRVKHNDFASVYSAFISSFPNEKNAIDEIFKNHGFFADISPENKKWDTGEEIGRAANGSSATRQARRSTELSQGQFINVDNQIPFYNVTIVVFDGIVFLSDITDIYTITVQNDDGLVYLPVPPESYNAWIYIEAVGVETKNPATFSSTEFYNKYYESVSQGYFTEYAFETEGEIPVLEKSLTEIDFKNDKDSSPSIAMIEIFFLILIATVFMYYRRTKKI